jgi:hypothetical protein
MKSLCSLVAILALAGAASAQESVQKTAGPIDSLPAFAAPEPTVPLSSGCTVFEDAASETAAGGFLAGNHNFPRFIGFLSDPLQSIDPRAMTDIYPIFGSAWVSSSHVLPEGDLQLYGAGLTMALSERISVGLNQGGYAVSSFAGKPHDGWLNLGGFAQYTLIQDVPNQFLVTTGVRWEAPSGEASVFQGHGPAILAPYLTAGKELDEFHVLGTFGYQFPLASGDSTTNLFYTNVHFDRRCFGWLYPLVEFNYSYHSRSVDVADNMPSGFFNFGNFEGTGNILALAVGFNAVVTPEKFEIGSAYTTTLATQRNFGENGLIVRMTFRY